MKVTIEAGFLATRAVTHPQEKHVVHHAQLQGMWDQGTADAGDVAREADLKPAQILALRSRRNAMRHSYKGAGWLLSRVFVRIQPS